MATHSSTLAWKIPWKEEPGRLQPMGSPRIRHNWATSLSLCTFTHWRRKWQPTPVFLPGESQDGGAWWAAIYGVAQSRTRLKRLSSSSSSRHVFRAVGETDLWWWWTVHLEKPLQKALLLTNNSISPLYIVLSFCGQGNFSSSESHSIEGTRRFNLCLKKIPEMFLQLEATQGHLSDTAQVSFLFLLL